MMHRSVRRIGLSGCSTRSDGMRVRLGWLIDPGIVDPFVVHLIDCTFIDNAILGGKSRFFIL